MESKIGNREHMNNIKPKTTLECRGWCGGFTFRTVQRFHANIFNPRANGEKYKAPKKWALVEINSYSHLL